MEKEQKARRRLSLKSKLLIYEYKERFPQLSPEEISMAFTIELNYVKKLFEQECIVVPSKMNKKR